MVIIVEKGKWLKLKCNWAKSGKEFRVFNTTSGTTSQTPVSCLLAYKSLYTKIMVSKNCPIIGEHVAVKFVAP